MRLCWRSCSEGCLDTTLTTILMIMKYLAAVLAGVVLGNGAVYCFNKIPASWLTDYGEAPPAELFEPGRQRITSYPWKYIFSMLFTAVCVYMVWRDWRSAVPMMAALWLLLEMSIADIKYRIIPDQFTILLAVSAIGFVNFHSSWTDCLIGAAAGFGLMGAIALVGKLAYQRMAIGGGDIKLYAGLGLFTGAAGVLTIFVLATLFSGAHFVYLLATRRIKKTDTMPMIPYTASATLLYFLFLWGRIDFVFEL